MIRIRGFTLIEVLVALFIVAIALAAGAQASSALVHNVQRTTDTLLGQVCAENELVKVKLTPALLPFGNASSTCTQAGKTFSVNVLTTTTPNPNFRRVDVQITNAEQLPVLRLSTIVRLR